MAKFGKISPSRSYPDFNMAMLSSPILPVSTRDPRIRDPWNFQERHTESLPPFPEEYAQQTAIPTAPYPNFVQTPDTGENVTPISKYTTLRPAKLSFSPRPTSSKPKGMNRASFCLMYPTHQAVQQNSLQIDDIRTIFASPLLQEHLHYLLMDYDLDDKKISECLKHLGIPRCLFIQYINRVYPQHFYTILSNINRSTQ